MFPHTPRAISAAFIIASASLIGCATQADFPEDESTEDDGNNVGGDPGTAGNTGTAGSGNTGEGGAGNTGNTGGTGNTGNTGGAGTGGNMGQQGDNCMNAADLNAATLPLSLTGSYIDAITSGPSCDDTPDNIVWYTYTPATTGWYDLSFANNTALFAYSRLAIWEGAGCSPLGTEVFCQAADAQTIETTVELTGGQQYLIAFYTDGGSYPMENPTADVQASNAGPGEICNFAEDLTSATMPHTIVGTFQEDPPALGSCDTSPTNVAWFKYTAAQNETYRIDASNNSMDGAWSRLVVLETDSCAPLGTEVTCETETSSDISADVAMTAGTTYLIAFHTDGDTYAMTDPVLDVDVAPPPPPGATCDSSVDVTSAAFPYQELGQYDDDPAVGGSCDATPTNAVWFEFTPATSDWYDLTLTNATTTFAYSRLAIFEGSSCSPLGTEIHCSTETDTTIAPASIQLTGGNTYQILFHTDGDSYTMIDPTIEVAVGAAPPPGDSCDMAVDLNAVTLPLTQSGNFESEPGLGGTCDSDATNTAWFKYTPAASGWFDVAAVNGSATSSDTRIAVFEGNSCASLATQVGCAKDQGTTVVEPTYLEMGKDYLIAVHTDSNTNPLEDPVINVSASTAPANGLACMVPENVTSATFPHAMTGTFADDDYDGSSCDATKTNVVWFSYTPATTQMYNITADNNSTTFPWSRIAVYEGGVCSPHGLEVACDTATSASISMTGISLTAGQEYLIAFWTDGESYSMVDPQITISP